MRNGEAPLSALRNDHSFDMRFGMPVATHVVVRTRLHTQLTTGLAASCVLVAAPAGWGKTMLVSSWLRAGGAPGAAAWISLGPGEDDLRAFWTSLADGLLPIVDDREARILRNAVAADDLEGAPGQFAAALAATSVVVVLDNLHEITTLAVHESLLRLIQRPPAGVRFIVTTRRDPVWPLHRLRMAGVLTEIRASDLAFRAEETQGMLGMLGIDLDEVGVDLLVERTEGWAAGLRLAATELQVASDPRAVVDRFSGDDHAVAAYLLDEVVDRLRPELVDFLAKVSILDVVSADLADALTGGRSGRTTLADLASSNLFVQAVGAGGQWYRLHRLIADVLRSRIAQPRTFRDLHRRAAEWYRNQAMPLDAVRYALRGGVWPLAAELVSTHLLALTVRGRTHEIDELLSGVPRDALLSYPELAGALAVVRLYQGLTMEMGELTAAALSGIDRLPPHRAERLRVVLDLVVMARSRARGDFVGAAVACRRIPTDPATLAALGLAAWDVVPLFVLSNLGTAELWTGDGVAAEKHLRAAIDTNHAGALLRPHLNAAAHLTLLHCLRGNLDVAQKEAVAVVDRATKQGWTVSVQVATAYLTLAWVALERDEQADADGWLERLAEVEAVSPELHVQLMAAALSALGQADGGDVEGALSTLRLATERLVDTVPRVLAERVRLMEVDLLRRSGDTTRASALLATLSGSMTAPSARAAARLQLQGGNRAAAEELLAGSPHDATARGRVESAVLHSMVAASTDPAVGLSWLEDALLSAAPLGMRRPFLVDAVGLRELLAARIEAGTAAAAFAVDLMRRMAGQGSRPTAVQVAALTDREQLILRYLASTLSNAEIAAELYLSVNTVKSHQRMVYRKLAADGRRDAVRRAKELGLL